MTKTEIRKQMKGLNTALSSEQREELSARIFNEAERLPAFARAKVVALFASLKDEPLTAPALERWSRSKRIVLPRVEGDIMRFYDYDPASMNDSGSFGISEPEATALCRPEEIDFIIVPGVAFTAAGMRLGRGKGFYDKYLSQPGFRGVKAGVCYAHQLVGELPVEPHDVFMDYVVTND
jgi:5-formyltetrahydrofolate cyclo-ligase